jgi:hypothetical protein
MEIPTEMILGRLRGREEWDRTREAEAHLPDKVDAEQDADLLRRPSIDPDELGGLFGGQSPSVG